ncbi:uncharacterized protein [Macrobrachium rosenbergii]|uniref:uncharacterized protein n=1 Tax=Macrobrachium rosenbergii TaxID=79674 RepID=UPI0034D4468F
MVVKSLLGMQASDLKAAWLSLGLTGTPSLQSPVPPGERTLVVTHAAATATTSRVTMTAFAKMPVTISSHFGTQVTAVPASQHAMPLPPGFDMVPPSQVVLSIMVTSIMPHMMVPALVVVASPVTAPVSDVPAAQAAPVALAAPVMSAAPSWMGDLTTILKKMKKKSRKRPRKVSFSSSATSSPASSETRRPKKKKAVPPPPKKPCSGTCKGLPPSTGEAVGSLVGFSRPLGSGTRSLTSPGSSVSEATSTQTSVLRSHHQS